MFTTRFAPSPTGHLHLGHAFSALTAAQLAHEAKGIMHLRIEDIDRTRVRAAFETSILDDLAWLGLSWPMPVMRQSERLAAYTARLEGLAARGLIYRCFRTRKEIEELSAPHGPLTPTGAPIPPPPSASEEKAALADGKPYAWRLHLDTAREIIGQQELIWQEDTPGGTVDHQVDLAPYAGIILGRKDIGTSYHIAAVHDDIDQGITHIIRGEDLREAAGLHRFLFHLFAPTHPAPIFRHHRLITDETGRRLAKRDKDKTLKDLRENGVSAREIKQQLGFS